SDRLALGNAATVQLRSLLPDRSTIRYTLDGSIPDSASRRYIAPLRLPLPDTGGVVVTARVILDDGRASPVRSARFSRTTLRPAERLAAADLAPEIRVAYFPRAFRSARAVGAARAGSSRVADSVALTGRERPETYGLHFEGFLQVPADGLYEFRLISDDGSVLSVGGTVVVDNDGWHSETARTGMIALAAGAHPLTVDFVQGSGGASLRALVRPADGNWEPLAGKWLARRPGGGLLPGSAALSLTRSSVLSMNFIHPAPSRDA